MSLLLRTVISVTAGFLLDLLLGDPRGLYHPVRLIGHLITVSERIIRGCFPKTEGGERAGGVLLVLVVLSVSMAVPGMLLFFAYRYAWQTGLALETFLCWQMLAAKSLKTESDKVYQALKEGKLKEARGAVSMIVGRDTENLSEEGVARAAVETVAENTSDGVTAPLFYMMIGGAVAGFGYKAVNTMDSMVGYKNERYRYFGTAAARLDDVANYIPSRITAWLMIAAACLAGLDGKNAAHIYRRDRRKHKSPNAAQTESVMAGALDIALAGNAWYFGKLYEKPVIGDGLREIEPEDIRRAQKLLYITAVLALVLFAGVRGIVWIA